jgi:putative aldouronate transport system substrate-binding protein
MKKRVGVLVALGLVTIMSMTALVGCGGKSSGSSVATSSKEATKPEKISWFINVGLTKEQGTDQFKEEFKKKTGIELDFEPQSNNEYNQNLELAFASKKAPDVFNLAGEDKLPYYASQGALADITDLVKASGLITAENKAAWDSVTINGKIYGVPWELNTGTVTYVRKDWLDKAGLKAPTNYEEYINMLRAFKKLPECKIPMTAPKLYEDGAQTYLREFYQDSTPEFTKVNGKWVDGMSQDNMKGALQRMQDAYKEGLIDTEVVTNTTSSCRDKFYAGGVGVFNYWAGSWNVMLEDRVKANVKGAQLVAIPAIKETKYNLRVPAVTSISKDCKNIEGVFKYLVQYMHDGGEGQALFEYGVEGLHWKQDGDHVTMLPKLDKPSELTDKSFITSFSALSPMKDKTKEVKLDERINTSDDLLVKNGVQQPARPVSKKLSKINGDLTKLKAKIIAQVVMGNTTPDEGLKTYNSEAKNLGIDEVVKEMNTSN